MAGMRNLRRGVRDKNFKQARKGLLKFAMFHAMMPVIFQYIAAGFPGLLSDWDDEDPEDLLRAAIIGNLNSWFIAGDILKGMADAAQGKPWADRVGSIPVFAVFADINKNYMKWQETKDADKKQESFTKMMARIGELATLGKIPFTNLRRLYENLEKAGEAKTGEEVALRLLNYSDYVVDGPEGNKKRKKSSSKKSKSSQSKGKKLSKREMKEYYPDLYKEMEVAKDPEFEAQMQDIKDMKKEQKAERKKLLEEMLR